MAKNEYTTFSFRWWFMWGCLTAMGNIIAQFWNDEWRVIISVGAPFVALIVAYLLSKFIKWWKMHDPVMVNYLIPKKDYREALFEGAGGEEKLTNSLTVSVGNYRIMHLIQAKREIELNKFNSRLMIKVKRKIDQGQMVVIILIL